MTCHIISSRGLTALEEKRICSILRESDCPDEALRASIRGYDRMEGDTIYIGKKNVVQMALEVRDLTTETGTED